MTAKEALTYYYELINEMNSNIQFSSYSYEIHDSNFFETNAEIKPSDLQQIYWSEILQRAHCAGLTSLIRNFKWTASVCQAIDDNNLLSFTSNLRCLIESCGDSIMSLTSLPKALSDNNATIKAAIKGEGDTLVMSEEFEGILNRLTDARMIAQADGGSDGKLPKAKHAKPASEYLQKLDNITDDGPISELYTVLCQFADPSAHSIHYLFDIDENEGKYDFNYAKDPDKEYIERVLNNYMAEIIQSLQYGFNSSLLTLKTLNQFDFELVNTPAVRSVNFDNLKSWVDIKDNFEE